jgi:ribonuclease Z
MSIKLVILGSGSATPTLQRNPSAQWLRIQDCDMLIDCGEGTQLQLLRFQLRLNKIRAIFISHLHGDHYLGLPGLISSMHLTGRSAPLQLFGPTPLMDILQKQFEVSDTRLSFRIDFTPVTAGQTQWLGNFEHFTVKAFPLNHRIACSGFLFREKPGLQNIRKEALAKYRIPIHFLQGIREGKDYNTGSGELVPNSELTYPPRHQASYAYCSDTAPDESYIQLISGVDCLYHEATFAADLKSRAINTYHSTAPEAAEIAARAGVKKLLIGHFSSRYRDVSALVTQARAIFPDTEAVNDGMEVGIGES